jgi:hypothetical protein
MKAKYRKKKERDYASVKKPDPWFEAPSMTAY